MRPSLDLVPSGNNRRAEPLRSLSMAFFTPLTSPEFRSIGKALQATMIGPRSGISKSDRRAMKLVSRGRQAATNGGSRKL